MMGRHVWLLLVAEDSECVVAENETRLKEGHYRVLLHST